MPILVRGLLVAATALAVIFPTGALAQECRTSTGPAAGSSSTNADGEAEATRPEVRAAADYLQEVAGEGLRVTVAGGYYRFVTPAGDVITAESLSEVLGVTLTDADMPAVLDLMNGAGGNDPTSPDRAGPGCSTGNLCSDLGACSFYGDLASATGDARERYLAEHAQDGRTYDDFPLPAFEARTIDGEHVSSSTLAGKPTLLAILAPHCGHSTRLLTTLSRLERRFAPRGVNVVGLYVNTSSIATARSRTEQYDLPYPLWTHGGDDLGDALESHLAPTMLFVDPTGDVQRKRVGEKTERELIAGLEALLTGGGDGPHAQAAR